MISIISVFHNRKDGVKKTVDSLLAQTYKDIEIILVDDGSKDGTLAELNKYKHIDSRVKIIAHENKGFTISIKEAVEESSGDIIAINGAGDQSHPERIEKQYRELFRKPCIGIVGCGIENINLTTMEKDKKITKVNSEIKYTEYLYKKNPYTHGEVMFKKSVYYKAGGYREEFTYGQDRDLWLRMSDYCHFSNVEEILYTRFYSFKNSVSGSYKKSVIQAYLSELAIQSHQYKEENGKGLVEEYGHDAKLIILGTSRLSKKITKLAVRAFREHNLNDAKSLLSLSQSIKITKLWVLAATSIYILSVNKYLYKYSLSAIKIIRARKN